MFEHKTEAQAREEILNLVAEYCDRFLIQDAGKVLALGTPREVKQRAAVLCAVSGQSLVVDRMSIEDAFVAIVEAGRRSQETPS